MPARVRYALRAAYEADPFCSSLCARVWHGAPAGANQAGRLGYRGGDKPGGSLGYRGGDR